MNNLVSWWYPIKSPINLFEPHKIPFTAWVHRILSPFNHYITITSPYGLLQSPLKCHFPYRLGPPVDSVQLRYFCGWILWFMVVMGFITNITGGTIQWTIANLNPPHEIRSEKCHFPIWNHEKSSFNQHFPMKNHHSINIFPCSPGNVQCIFPSGRKQHQTAACPSHLSKEIRHLPGLFLGACHTWATPDGTGLSDAQTWTSSNTIDLSANNDNWYITITISKTISKLYIYKLVCKAHDN